MGFDQRVRAVDRQPGGGVLAVGDVSAISVEPVSLLTPTNTITTGGIWGLLFILVIPARC